MLTVGLETRWIDWQGESIEVVADRWVFQAPDGAGLRELAAALPDVGPDDSAWRLRSLGGNAFTVTTPGRSPDDVVTWVASIGATQLMPDLVFRDSLAAVPRDLPDDPRFGTQWPLRNTGQIVGFRPGSDINAIEGWHYTTGSRQAVVAVIDTGLDYRHPDLAANIWTNPGEIAGDGIDNDANGYVDDVHGYDFFYDDGDPAEYLPAGGATTGFGHGTRSAGIVGAVGNNATGVTGTAWEVSLMGLKVFSEDGSQTAVSIIVEAINYATMMKQRGVNVVATNNSYGGRIGSTTPDAPDNPYRAAIDAGGAAGILFVASSGNNKWTYDDIFLGVDNDVRPTYPASVASDYVISVAASLPWDALTGFSTYGLRSVDLAAPGLWGWATYPTTDPGSFPDGIAPYSGTSMAAPHVAGAVALLSTAMPGATPLQIRSAIIEAVRTSPALDGKVASGGVLDVGAAMRLLASRLGLDIADPGPIAMPENRLPVITATATATSGRPLQWSIGGGADQNLLTIDPATGALAFRTGPDFEAPQDSNRDNRYEVVVRATDGTATAVRPLVVAVTDVDEMRPTVAFAIVPSPRLTAADTIGLTFSKPVSGFGIEDLELLRDDVLVSLVGATVTGSGAAYTIEGLASISEAAGTYTLRLRAADTGIQDALGNPLLGNPQARWTVAPSGPPGVFTTPASWTAPENTTAVGTLGVSGFPMGSTVAFRIVGGADADQFVLDPTSGSLSFRSPQDYEAPGNAAGGGTYLIDVEAGFGNLSSTQRLAVHLADADEIPPTISIRSLPALRQGPLASIIIEFSEPVTGFDKAAIELLRDGNVVSLSTAVLSGAGPIYTLGNLTALTATDGQYELRVVQKANTASVIKDAASNPVVKGEARWTSLPSPTAWVLAETSWVMRAGVSERPVILKDINRAYSDASYGEKAVTDTLLFFAANKERVGGELWVSDGTSVGTRLVADLRPGQEPNSTQWKSSLPRNFVTRDGVAFFSAYIGDPEPGFPYPRSAVFRSDGTAAGTRPISEAFVAVGYIRTAPGGIVFSGWDGIESDLWFSDGTSEGSVRIDGITSPDDDFVVLGDTLVFDAEDTTGQRGLWRWNPRLESRPSLVAGSFDPDILAVANDRIFFQNYAGWYETPEGTVSPYIRGPTGAFHRVTPGVGAVPGEPVGGGFSDTELWVSDGTVSGTYVVKDIALGSKSSLPRSMTPLGDKVLFTADDGVHGRELWITDGTEGGTQMLLDILPGTGDSEPGNLTVREGFVYFSANDGVHGRELWRTNGTREGTSMLVDIYAGPGSSSPRSNQRENWQNLEPFIQHAGIMYFTALTADAGWELWRSDGTPSGTWLVHDIRSGSLPNDTELGLGISYGPSNFRILRDTLFFDASDGVRYREVWRYELPTWTPKVSSPAFVEVPESSADVLRVTARYLGPASELSFSIVGGADADRFTITPSSGVVSFRTPPRHAAPDDADGDNIYQLIVRVSTALASSDMAVDIAVLDATTPPTAITLSESWATLPEDRVMATRIRMADILLNDDPFGTNTISLSGADAACFEVVPTADRLHAELYLRAGTALNYEAKASYTVTVSVSDAALGGTSPLSVGFTLTVTNVNEAPSDIALSSTSIAAAAGANAVVGTFSTTDPDTGDEFAYSLVVGTGSTDNGSFTLSENQLVATTSLDFTVQSSYLVRVRSTDRCGLFTEKSFTITVTNNQNPTDIAISSTTIAENAGANTVVGTLSTTDPGTSDTFTYSLVTGTGSTDNASFNISGNQLRATASLDFETKSSYSARVRSTNQGGLFFEKAFTINVADVNEAPADIALSSTSIAENAGANVVVGTLSTADPDTGDTFAYSLVAGIGSMDNASFNISGNQLRATASLDFETKSSYSVRVRSTDQGGLFTEKAFTITVTNVNETPTGFSISASSIAENSAIGTAIGTFSTVDPDTGSGFVYTFVMGAGDADNAAFTIVGAQLQSARSFDFQSKSSYSIRVRSTDTSGLFIEKSFTITVTNINEHPTDIALSSTSIAENAGANVVVGTLSTADPDTGDTFACSLVAGTGSMDNASFNISGNQLRATASLDFETKSSYSVRVRSTDQGGLFTEKAFTITVTNINEAPAGITLTPAAASLAENSVTDLRIKVADVKVADDTIGTNMLTLSGTDAATFEIIGGSIYLRAGIALDYERKNSYSATVTVTDATIAGSISVTTGFSLLIGDINEPPVGISLSNSSVAEKLPAGAFVGRLSTSDPDRGDLFSYDFAPARSALDNAAFVIEGDAIRTAGSFDFGSQSTYTIGVRSTDRGGLWWDTFFTITVRDVVEAPGAPSEVRGTFGDGQVYLAWTAPGSDGGSGITDYVIEYSSDLGGTWKSFSDSISGMTSAIVSGLSNGTSYIFRVSAVNAVGPGSPSAPSSSVTPRTVPGSPTNVTGIAGNRQVSLSWNAPGLTGGAPITDYVVEYSVNNGSSWTTFPDGTSTATSTTITGLTNGTSHVFRVSAVNVAGAGATSVTSAVVRPSTTAPVAPTNVIATPGNGQVILKWTVPTANGGAPITDYVIQYSRNNGSTWTTFRDDLSKMTLAKVKGLTNGTSYLFRVSARNSVGNGLASDPSAAVTPRTIPAAPTGVTAMAGNGRATLRWIAPTNNGGDSITDYVIQYSLNNGSTWITFGDGTSTETSTTLTGLANGRNYVFRVQAVNAAGRGVFSIRSATVKPFS